MYKAKTSCKGFQERHFMVDPVLQRICGQLDHLSCKACSVRASVPESNIKPSYFPSQGQRVLGYLKATPSHLLARPMPVLS